MLETVIFIVGCVLGAVCIGIPLVLAGVGGFFLSRMYYNTLFATYIVTHQCYLNALQFSAELQEHLHEMHEELGKQDSNDDDTPIN